VDPRLPNNSQKAQTILKLAKRQPTENIGHSEEQSDNDTWEKFLVVGTTVNHRILLALVVLTA
jgi:hypothetical protein